MAETPNYSEITIYNLSAQTENTLIKTSHRIVLEAGYEGAQYGLIFDGDVVQPFRDKQDGTTYMLTLVSQDGDKFLNDGVISASYRAGQTPRAIANEVTSKASNPIELASISENLENKELARGKAVFGLARDYLHQIARTEQAAFYVCEGKVNIVKAMDLPKGRIIDLTPKSGLIGTPEQTEDGVKAKCLLNPLLNLNSFVRIDNNFVRQQKAQRGSQPKQMDYDGVYRIIKLTHTGGYTGGYLVYGVHWRVADRKNARYGRFHAVRSVISLSSINIGERIGDGEEQQRRAMENAMANMRVSMPGEIVDFDAEKQTATVQPLIKEYVRGEWKALPQLLDVPCFFPRAGGYCLTFPVKPKDECVILFNDMCLDAWWQSGGQQTQLEIRRHDLSDAMALLGITSREMVKFGLCGKRAWFWLENMQVPLCSS